jgi:Signal transduction histidine kinase
MTHLDSTTETLDRSITQIKHNAQHFAHELRTPMTHLKNELELANETVDLSRALNKADDVIRIFNAVQRINRLSNRHVLERREEVSLNDAVSTVSDLYKEVIEDNDKALITATNATKNIIADRQLITQLQCNLVENAMRYAGEHGIHMRKRPYNGRSPQRSRRPAKNH